MATVTDITGNQNTIDDNTSTQVTNDSNINVFEFGNLILADILPALLWLVNYIADINGSSLTITDSSGSSISDTDDSQTNSMTYDQSGFSYDDISMLYDGYMNQGGLIDISGS